MADKPKRTTTKKTTAKSSTTKKAAAKKVTKRTTTRKPVAPKPPVNPTPMSSSNVALPWTIAALALGLFVGAVVHGLSWSHKVNSETLFYANGKTWIPVDGEPLRVTVVNDPTCGRACDPGQSLGVLRQNITPALITETVDVNSAAGQALVEKFNIKSVPQYVFAEELEDFKAADGSNFVENLPAGFLIEKDDEYLLNSVQVGFRIGKFLETPQFADMDTEPKLGDGGVTVVEFTNYQCGFCKKLHDENKDLIAQLVADGIINYVVKDAPMFGANDRFAHRAANCVLREGGQDAHWKMNAAIFASQAQWSRADGAERFFNNLASDLGYDITACVADPVIEAEIQADMAEARLYGVNGTPALFVGSQSISGAVGPEVLGAAIQAEASK